MAHTPLVIGLHRVGHPPPDATIRGLFISQRLLAFQLKLISRMGYSFSTLRDAWNEPDRKTAVVTFDDGYEDILQAVSILDDYGATATVFVITDDVGERGVVWEEAGEKLPADMLTWKSLAFLQQHGWEIASHSNRHVHFTRYTEAQQFDFVSTSIMKLEERLGQRIVSFAYPYNSYNAITKAVVARLGIQYAVTTNACRTRKSVSELDQLELSRVSLGGYLLVHYFKCLIRLGHAVGPWPVIVGLVNVACNLELRFTFAERAMRKFLAVKDRLHRSSYARVSATDNNIVTRKQGEEWKQTSTLLLR